ncbi:serine/threonine-protein kinase [Enhygromyxa salina]|uniref:serine/threonine-protein kinase n=1 Tax=Enhygromyxa salina TaxID=215803 RepID=UPI0015E746F4|nr:serine/threonine-protein kinase [Enhygromyxa salina]
MNTAPDHESGTLEATVPEPIASLDVEVQAMFERVRVRLGMRAGGPEMVGRYELRDWIGRGGMGEVYRAYDTELEREVALKLIAPRPGSDSQVLRQRLRREAQLLAKLDHPNVVKVYDSGGHQGRAYLVMEFVRGATLRQLQAVGALSTPELLTVYIQAGRGLVAAHERGVVHRDFKPDNVFVGDDRHARVGDFGLAHVLGEVEAIAGSGGGGSTSSRLTQAGELLGTLGYMAPEQLRGEGSNARADQYAFCAALWEALTGDRPFAGASSRALIEAMQTEPRGGEEIDGRLRRALLVGLSARPEQRHASVAELLAAIEELLERPARRRRRRRRVAGGLIVSTGLVAVILGYRAKYPDCPLADEVATLAASTDWDAVASRTSRRTADRLQSRLTSMRADAARSCVIGDEASRQHVNSLLGSLRTLLDAAADEPTPQWAERVAMFELDFVSKATVPMSDSGYKRLLDEVKPLDDAWRVDELIAKCEEIERVSWESPADRAAFLLICGRARSVKGDWSLAMANYRQARLNAESIADRQRRLRANLEAARTVIMRQQEYERGEELLAQARDLLSALKVGVYDPRRAEYDEIAGVLARAQDRPDEALTLTRRAVRRQLLVGTNNQRVPALTNLANLRGARAEPVRAELAFRLALYLGPNDPEAAYNLARFLSNEDHDLDEARALLETVLASDEHDLRLIATTCLLGLQNESDDRAAVAGEVAKLIALLRDPQIPRTPEHEVESWMTVALTLASLGDDGPEFRAARDRVPLDYRPQLDAAIAAMIEAPK